MHAHVIAGQAQRLGELVRVLGHLDRRPDVEQLRARIPLRRDAEGLDRHRRAATPADAERQLVFGLGKILCNRAPGERSAIEDVAAVLRVHQHRAGEDGFLRIEHIVGRLVVDLDALGGVLGQRARIGDHGDHPLACIAHDASRKRVARHLGRVDADIQRVDIGAEFLAGQRVVHAGHRQRLVRADRLDARRGMRTRDQRDVLHAGQRDVSHVVPAAGDEARVFLGAALGAYVLVAAHLAPFAMFSAASCTASTICW